MGSMYKKNPAVLLQDTFDAATEGCYESICFAKTGRRPAAMERTSAPDTEGEAKSGIRVLSPRELREVRGKNAVLARVAGELETLFCDAGMSGIAFLTHARGVALLCLGEGQFPSEATGVTPRPGPERGNAAAGTGSKRELPGGSAASVFDSGEAIAGVLDLTGAADGPQTNALALVSRVAEHIKQRMFEDRFQGYELVHFYPDPYLIGGSHGAMLAFDDGRLVGASRDAVALLGQDRPLLGTSFDSLFAVEPESVSRNAASDDCILHTKDGRSFYARIRQQSCSWEDWTREPQLGPQETGDAPQLRQIVGRILNGPASSTCAA
jgi:transcriptional regulator of acetoin/glycerol metabolism